MKNRSIEEARRAIGDAFVKNLPTCIVEAAVYLNEADFKEYIEGMGEAATANAPPWLIQYTTGIVEHFKGKSS